MKKGTLYCVGMGPGDPELLTFKAWHALCHCPVLALPEDQSGRQTAATILKEAAARQDGLYMDEKTMLSLTFPMTRDAAVLQKAHEDASQKAAAVLDQGLDMHSLPWAARQSMRRVCIFRKKSAAGAIIQSSFPVLPVFRRPRPVWGSPCVKKTNPFSSYRPDGTIYRTSWTYREAKSS